MIFVLSSVHNYTRAADTAELLEQRRDLYQWPYMLEHLANQNLARAMDKSIRNTTVEERQSLRKSLMDHSDLKRS